MCYSPRDSRTVIAILAVIFVTPVLSAADVNDATEKAMKAASAKVAPTVVKIETAGGAEAIGGGKKGPGGGGPAMRKGTGPTTGVIVDPEGFVITSSFNFAHKPTDIFVTIPGRPQRLVAKVVANDQTRMLTLLKVDAKDLPVPAPFPKKDVDIGLWAMASVALRTRTRSTAVDERRNRVPRTGSGARRFRPTQRPRRSTMAARSSRSTVAYSA